MIKCFKTLIYVIIPLSCIPTAVGQWNKIADLSGGHFTDIQFFDESIGFTIGDEYIFNTTDGGHTWDSTQLGEALDILYEFDFIDPDTGYVVGDATGFQGFYTMNQGDNWIGRTPYILYDEVAMINGNEVVVARDPAEPAIYLINLAESSVETLLSGAGNDIQVFPQDTIYVGGGVFAKSFDKGENWITTEMPGILYMNFPSSEVGYTTYEDLLFKTTDYGDTWAELELPSYFDACTALEFANDTLGYYPCVKGGAYSGIMKTNDGGQTWIFNDLLPLVLDEAITGISCITSDTCWCVTSDGQIYFTNNGGGETLPPTSIHVPEASVNFSVFPNPSSELVHFTVKNITGEYWIVIQNMLGENISEMTCNSASADWNCSEESRGVYMYTVKQNGQIIATGKIIIQ